MLIINLCCLPAFRFLLIQFCTFPAVKKYIIDPYYKEHPGEDIQKRRDLGLDIPEEDDKDEDDSEGDEDNGDGDDDDPNAPVFED